VPYYYFENDKGEEETHFMSISEYDQFVIDHPTYKQLIKAAPALGDPIRQGLVKPSSEFRDRLKDIKKSHKHSTINTW
jgi:hypothetical protein